MKKKFLIGLTALFLLAVVAIGGIAAVGWTLFTSPGPFEGETVYILKKGTGLRALSADLQEKAIINNQYAFIFGVRLEEKSGQLQASEYRIPAMNCWIAWRRQCRRRLP